MTTLNDNIDLKTKVQIICLYFSKLPSNDKRRSKIISKYRELEILTGIKANTIRQWTDSFDPYFDNGRKGYHLCIRSSLFLLNCIILLYSLI